MKRWLILGLTAFVFSGCGKRIRPPAHAAAQRSGVLTARAEWLKSKGDKFDMMYSVTNESGGPIVIMNDDVRCAIGAQPGRITGGPLAEAGLAQHLGQGVTKQWLVVCSAETKGDFQISLTRVYRADPSGVAQELLGDNISLVLAPNGEPRQEGAAIALAGPVNTGGRGRGGVKGLVNNLLGRGDAQPTPASPSPQAPPPAVTPAVSSPRPKSAVIADPSWVVAVMDVEEAGSKRLDKDLVSSVGDQLRIFVTERGIRTIDKSAQERAIKEQIEVAKSDSYKACYDSSCQIELGKALAASHILRTKITRFGSKCVLNGELVDLKAEVTISAGSSKGDCGEEGFLRMSEELAQSLTGR